MNIAEFCTKIEKIYLHRAETNNILATPSETFTHLDEISKLTYRFYYCHIVSIIFVTTVRPLHAKLTHLDFGS